jgi:hypothetical protein
MDVVDQERDSWEFFLHTVMYLSGFLKYGEFLECLKRYKVFAFK